MRMRLLGFVALAIAAVLVVLIGGPEPGPDSDQFDTLVEQALRDFETNEERAEGAPQQQVVNGWTNRDLLTVISMQLSAGLDATGSATDQRIPLLLLLLVLAVAWHGTTEQRAHNPTTTQVPPAPPVTAVDPPADVGP